MKIFESLGFNKTKIDNQIKFILHVKSKYIIVTSRAWGEESYNKLKIRKGEKWF